MIVHDATRFAVLLAVSVVMTIPVTAQQTLEEGQPLKLTEGLVVSRVLGRGRVPLKRDPVASRLLENPARIFSEDEQIAIGDETRSWKKVVAAENGQFQGREYTGSYLQFQVHAEKPQVVLLEANGHAAAIVNGEARSGDPYNKWHRLPIKIHAGQNQLLFQVGRGRFNGQLLPIEKPVSLSAADMTLPTLLRGNREPVYGAIPLINASEQSLNNLEIRASIDTDPACITSLGPILPMSLRKVAFKIQPPPDLPDSQVTVSLKLMRSGRKEVLDSREIQLSVGEPDQRHQRTFISRVDGSVQYYAVTPANPQDEVVERKPGLILSLHGAGVEGRGQAGCYQPKPDMHVVAPTNRRAFGFDWEDWGRIDALEVMEDAARHLEIDSHRTYLSGHSMGGHGTWQLGAHFPDKFAAIGPSAGWISFWTYAGGAREAQPSPVLEILQRAANPSDTLLMKNNYAGLGVYVLHGDRDNNVPVGQARQMRKVLAEFHPDFSYYERPGAGHWWGNPCVDWPPMIEFFRRHTLTAADKLNEIDFTTVCPGNSARYGWATIVDQLKPLHPSRIQLTLNRSAKTLTGKTKNTRLLKLDLPETIGEDSPGKFEIELDGDSVTTTGGTIWLRRTGDTWQSAEQPQHAKGPHRFGLFKSAFDHQFVLVYSTSGTEEENKWSLNKARYDAETFWYRGNGSADVISDREFKPKDYADRNVILYGNSDTNRAWSILLADCPLQLTRKQASIGDRIVVDPRLATLFVYPKPDSTQNVVGVVGGTGIEGLRSTNSMRYFVSGIAFPDLMLVSADYLDRGTSALVAAGFWDSNWQVDKADIEWQERE
jgi:pimeloyl-ACP methyl ester carboxylesterase